MARNNSSRAASRRSSNNNPEGRNQYSGLIGMARGRPATTAAVAAGAAAAGVFLWSKRDRNSEQLSNISDQIGEWTESRRPERELEMAGGEASFAGESGARAADRSARPAAARRAATSGGEVGSGTMSGGSLDTGPSGRGRE